MEPSQRRFSLAALSAATRGFSEEIGAGATGRVYSGVLPDGLPVAVKRLSLPAAASPAIRRSLERTFHREIGVLARLRHPRIVELFGVAVDERPDIEHPFALVTELLEGGSLDQYLLPATAGTAAAPARGALTALQRIDAAIGAAAGLAYLHGQPDNAPDAEPASSEGAVAASGADADTALAAASPAQPFLHRDVKSANVSAARGTFRELAAAQRARYIVLVLHPLRAASVLPADRPRPRPGRLALRQATGLRPGEGAAAA